MALSLSNSNSNSSSTTSTLVVQSKSHESLDSLLSYLQSINFPPPSHPNLSIIISPGPGDPRKSSDLGLSKLLLTAPPSSPFSSVPILGVCLGHQAIAVEGGDGDFDDLTDDSSVMLNEGGGRHGVLSGVSSSCETVEQTLAEMFLFPGEQMSAPPPPLPLPPPNYCRPSQSSSTTPSPSPPPPPHSKT